jgi:hypothetical protein
MLKQVTAGAGRQSGLVPPLWLKVMDPRIATTKDADTIECD